MSVLSLENIRHETRQVIAIQGRTVGKRLVTLALILAVIWYAGSPGAAVAIALLVLPFEASMALIARVVPPTDEEVSVRLVAWTWLTNVPSTAAYCAPALALVARPELPWVLTGWMWLFGLYVHMANSFVALPFYNWSQMVPAFGMALTALAVAAGAHGWGEEPWLWAAAGALFLVYAFNTIETMGMQKRFHRELAATRAQAKARLDALEHLTRHDPLTGLLNRQAFDAELARVLARRRVGRMAAVFLIDLDGFKPINDSYSHAAGDAVLAAIAARLGPLAEGGLAARLGGDEFAVAVPALGSGEDALALAGRLLQAVERPVAHEGKDLAVSASIGIALSHARPPPGAEGAAVAALCAEADQAMYRAKAAARSTGRLASEGRAVLYSPAGFPPRPSLEDRRRLLEAMDGRRIRPEYQPIVDLDTGRVTGFEALARWRHPEKGLLAPAAFLPLITELGLQGDFLSAMARQVLEDVAGLVEDGLDPGRVSLNIPEIALATHSGRQDLDRLLAAHPRARRHIVFEITEDVFIARAAEMIQGSIAHFRAQGVGISLDDFGTGFASFHHLRQIEFDELKIDVSFVKDLGRDPAAETLVGGFVTMGAGLGARLIAEGVETEAQRRHLLRLGCRQGQGFLFGRAMPIDETRVRLMAMAASYPSAVGARV